MFQAKLKVEMHCASCDRYLSPDSVVWYDPTCGCVYCSDECKRAAGK